MVDLLRPAGRLSRGLNAALALVLAGALALLGAHLPAPPGGGAGPDLTAYAMPDGTLPVLCLTGHDGDGPDAAKHCPDCVVAKVLAVVAPAPAAARRETAVEAARLLPEIRLAAARPRAPPARGPPSPLPI